MLFENSSGGNMSNDIQKSDGSPQSKSLENPLIEFDSVTLHYESTAVNVTEKLSFTIESSKKRGRFVVFLGPSGCGKSTLLRAIAGLIMPSNGEVRVLGETVFAPSGKRGLVFQDYSCFDWLTVLENVLFPLKLKTKGDLTEARELAYKYIDMVGLRDIASYYPKQLSGGMRQRVAIARTLINEPDLLLMDEPFGALDAFTREDMQGHLLSIWAKSNNNIVFVTHDIGEAVLLADEIFVMSAAPMQVYARHKVEIDYTARTKELKYTMEFTQLVKTIEDEIRAATSKK
jgi:NitT/TauT family transport system ATP-binding protein